MLIRTLKLSSPPLLLCAALFHPLACRADVRLPAIISDNMVLQQKTRATVWGDADPNEKITVKIGAVTQGVTTGEDGHWAVKLPVMRAGGPYDMTISGHNKITVQNVLVGEVWLCSGQSNMTWRVSASKDAQAAIAAALYPKIRVFTVQSSVSDKPQSACAGKWEVCDPSTAGNFSAVAYFFGMNLFQTQKLPIGLIVSSSNGPSKAEDWIPAAGFDLDPSLKSLATGQSADATMAAEEYKRRFSDWVNATQKAKEENQPAPPEPSPPPGSEAKASPTSTLFNGMIAPLLPWSIHGVVWYQGESNTPNPQLYRKLFPVLIRSWRHSWGDTDFPFLFVQLPGFRMKRDVPGNSSWAELREAQAMTLKLPKTSMAVTIDIGEDNIHPADKQDVGRRLALLAQANVYGDDITASGPVLVSSKVDGGKMILVFKEPGGLAVKDGQFLKGFAIAGADRNFVWANAEIDGNTVIVSADQVPKPVAVRYAWADNPYCNLIGKEGLSAAPFRTDDW